MKYILLPFVLSCFVVGCTQMPTHQNPMTITSSLNVDTQKGADLSVNLDLDSFKVKVSNPNTDGTIAKKAIDIKSVRLYLTKSDTNPLLAANVMKDSTVLAYKTNYTFSNVPAGTYYVAAELYSDLNGTTNIIEPIAYTSGNGNTGTKGLSVSTNSATISNDLSVTFSGNGLTSFDIKPKLLNAVGAKLVTSVVVNDGNNTSIGGNNISSSVQSVVN